MPFNRFTFDYEILSTCEKRHPNDFIARTVCNNNLEKEKKITVCAAKELKSIESKFDEIHALLEVSYPTNIRDLEQLLLKHTKLSSSVIGSKNDPERKVIVFHIPTSCNVGYDLLVNIYERKADGVAFAMSVWRKDDPKNENSTSYRVSSYEWDHKYSAYLKSLLFDLILNATEAENSAKLKKIEVEKLKKIAEIFSSSVDIDAAKFKTDTSTIFNNFIDVVNQKSLIFEATKSKLSNDSVQIVSTSFPELKYNFSHKIEGNQINLILMADKARSPLYARSIDGPAPPLPPKLAPPIADEKSYLFHIITLLILVFIGVIFIFSKKIIAKFTFKKEKAENIISSTTTNATSPSNLSQSSSNPGVNLHNFPTDFLSQKALEEFSSKYPFVKVSVDPSLRMQFIEECTWLEKKIGNFPSEKEQLEILNSLTSKKIK